MAPLSESESTDELREYLWASEAPDEAFADGLAWLLRKGRCASVGLAIRSSGQVAFKAWAGQPRPEDKRLKGFCEAVLLSGEAKSCKLFRGQPIRNPEGDLIAVLFLYQATKAFGRSADEALELSARHIAQALELRRLDYRLNQARQELHQKQRAQVELKRVHRDFLSHLSHEMRTPLHAVLGLTELLQDESHKEHYPKLLSHLTKSSQHMLETLNVLLEHSKLEAGALRFEPSRFALKEFLDETLGPFEAIVQGRGLAFHRIESLPASLVCSVDRVRLRQVINNLIGNALKFTENGSITVEVLEVPDVGDGRAPSYRFAIKDTGLGIQRQHQSLLFEPYRQVSGDSSRGGSGLGLSICKKIVEGMGGRIGLESEYGRGSTFWFQLPLPIEQDEENPEPRPLRSLGRGIAGTKPQQSGRILLIEDNPISRTVTTKTLEALGYEVESVDTLPDAIAILDRDIFDLVLMDRHLGDVPPAVLFQEVRSRSSAPLVAMSGSETLPAEDFGPGFDAALQKPCSREALWEMAQTWVFCESRTTALENDLEASLRTLETSVGSPFIHQTIASFVKRHPEEVAKLQRYLHESNWAKLELTAHSMKSTLATLGLMELSRFASELESAAAERNRAFLEPLVDRLRIDARRSYPRLLRFVNRTFTLRKQEIAS